MFDPERRPPTHFFAIAAFCGGLMMAVVTFMEFDGNLWWSGLFIVLGAVISLYLIYLRFRK